MKEVPQSHCGTCGNIMLILLHTCALAAPSQPVTQVAARLLHKLQQASLHCPLQPEVAPHAWHANFIYVATRAKSKTGHALQILNRSTCHCRTLLPLRDTEPIFIYHLICDLYSECAWNTLHCRADKSCAHSDTLFEPARTEPTP